MAENPYLAHLREEHAQWTRILANLESGEIIAVSDPFNEARILWTRGLIATMEVAIQAEERHAQGT